MTKATQQQQILAYCTEHGSITIREAFDNLNINSPTKRISEMRNSGLYHVETAEEKRTDADGVTKRWYRYFIRKLEASHETKA